MKSESFFRVYWRAVEDCFKRLLVDPLSINGRATLRLHYEQQPVATEPQLCPSIALSEASAGGVVRLLSVGRKSGDVQEMDLLALCTITASHRPKRIFEIGTFRGRSTLCLALNADPEGKVFTLDLPQSFGGKDSSGFGPYSV
jgi:hypothetical protein